ncbi:hypothetical protein LJC60_08900 [Ruminococcaceae bacterium OttesenSCG-928-D13]|nr:hypothetical protein [Ruminococcaceae bacterium OttesenSCG-928-D13]
MEQPDQMPMQPQPDQNAPAAQEANAVPDAPGQAATDGGKKKQKGKEGAGKTLIRVLITLLIIAVGIFLVLFLVAKAGRFDSIGSMLQHMFTELSLMWQRISA